MRKNFKITLVIAAVLICAVGIVLAGHPHFIGVKITQSNSTLYVTGKEAGLGNETQVHIEASADAACINRGGHNPNAENKTTASAEGDFPVQNGKAYFDLELVATFQPDCSPPMTVVWTNVVVTDTEHNVTYP